MSDLATKIKQPIKLAIYTLKRYYKNLPIPYQTRIKIRKFVLDFSPRLFQILSASYVPSGKMSDKHRSQSVKKDSIFFATKIIKNIDIEKYDILSLDVFDTAIIRLCRSPDGVFDYIESKFNLTKFKEKRILAEKHARARYRKRKDISINEIYQNIDLDKNIEINSEMVLCVANPIIYDLYCRAKTLNKEIYFLSDMYLEKEHIKNILKKSGYCLDRLYVSSSDDLIKGDGSRFAEIKEIIGNKKMLHIGDNELADVKWPQKLGIDAIKFHTSDEFFDSDYLLSTQYMSLSQHKSSGLQFLMGAYRFWKYGDRSREVNVWRDIGFFYGGPLIFSLVKYIKEAIVSRKNQHRLFFLSRDGRIVKKVFDRLYGKEYPDSTYLLVSRRAVTFPLFSIRQKTADILNILRLYSVIDIQTTFEELFNRIGYPELVNLKNDFQVIFQKKTDLSEESINMVLEKHQTELASLAKIERNALMKYLTTVSFMDDKESILVDVGWGGTIQSCLDIILHNAGYQKEISGVYIGVTPNCHAPEKKSGLFFDRSHTSAYADFEEFFDFIELLTSSPEKGIRRFTTSDLYIEYETDSPEEEHRINISTHIQKGILDFVEIVLRTGLDNAPPFTHIDFINLFRSLRDYASKDIIEEFSRLRHSRMPSGSFVHPIIKFGDVQ